MMRQKQAGVWREEDRAWHWKIRNSKHEIRNEFKAGNSKSSKWRRGRVKGFDHFSFGSLLKKGADPVVNA
jgi:hypothetical protein